MDISPVIFVIDDSEIDCLIVNKLLHQKFPHIKLEAFHSADEALETIKNLEASHSILPSLILLDINMPVKNGWEFLDEYQALAPQSLKQIKVIIFTSSIHPADPITARQYKMVVDFIVKPIRKEDIEEKISRYC
ncbi:response regulator [Rhodocytophaga rosea]|uniref:Response regulator n=1 Tax=Rhodocytophaga rosea TaxID=2704465 RepID=A0A6C0GU29_9BACT|nr:response regulator [Rhodocytophaga rosea]QHT71053.1 response regulator [Rhodocytophaga rosea]